MKKFFKLMVGIIVLLCVGQGSAFSQDIMVNAEGDVIQRTDNGTFNWTSMKICATGYSDPDQTYYAKRTSAGMVARANLLAVLDKVIITMDTTVEEGRLRKDIITGKVEGILIGSYLSDPVTLPGGVMEIKACKGIGSDFRKIIQPVAEKDKRPKFIHEEPITPASQKYTGLIIDARGTGAKPAMSPKVLVEGSGQVVYGIEQVNRAFVIQNGMTGYVGTVEKARQNDRIGDNPLVVKAKRAEGNNKVNFVISKEDAVKIYQSHVNQGQNSFLKQCKVVIVLG